MTAVITSIPAQGPRVIAARAPPSKWPEVPPATGKLIIWAAKIKAAITPINGTCLSPRDLFEREIATLRIRAVITQQMIETVKLKNPSGMCIGSGEYSIKLSSSSCFFGNPDRFRKRSYDYQYANIRWSIPICGTEFPARHVPPRFHLHNFDKPDDGDPRLQFDTLNVHSRFEKDGQSHFPSGIRGYDKPSAP